jgi:hypothetical protein
MKIVEDSRVLVNTSLLAMGDTFRYMSHYYIQTNRGGRAVNLATGLETEFASGVMVERVTMECRVIHD